MKKWGILVLMVVLLAGFGVHEYWSRALVEESVAGALLAGGGSGGSIVAAAGFLVFRLMATLVLCSLPAVVLAIVWWLVARAAA